MSVGDVMRSQVGTLDLLVGIEGVREAFASGFGTWTGSEIVANGWVVMQGVLRRKDMRHKQVVDIAKSDLAASAINFALVDAENSSGQKWSVTNLMRGLAAALVTEATETLDAGETALDVVSTAGFPSSGDICIGLETLGYTAITATQFQNLTRGKYGSLDSEHLYAEPQESDAGVDYGVIPEVTNIPISWYGRHVYLYAAKRKGDGTLEAGERVWTGKITGDVAQVGVEWHFPTESVWASTAVELCSAQPTTVVRGIHIAVESRIRFTMQGFGLVDTERSSFLVDAGTYRTPGDFYAHCTERLNAAIAALVSSPNERYEIYEEDGLVMSRLTAPANTETSDHHTDLYFRSAGGEDGDTRACAAMFGCEVMRDLGEMLPTMYYGLPETNLGDYVGNGGREGGPILAPITMVRVDLYHDGVGTVVPVERADDFEAWDSEGATWFTRSVVTIDGSPYLLLAVDTGTDELTVQPFTDRVADPSMPLIVQYHNEPPIEVRLGVWFRGNMPTVWRDAFMANGFVPEALKLGCDSRDFDWSNMDDHFGGGMVDRRDRLLTGPVNLKQLLVEDFRYSGVVPIITLGGLISCRPIHVQNLVRDDGELAPRINHEIFGKDERPSLRTSPRRVINKVRVKITREVGRPLLRANARPIAQEVTINHRSSQWRYRMTKTENFDFSGSAATNPYQIAGHIAGAASSLFNIFARDYPTTNAKGNALRYGTLPMDTCLVSHWLLPDQTRARTRGIVDVPSLCYGVEVDFAEKRMEFDLIVLTDGAKRSGFAPAAIVTAYTDMGGGTEPRRYRLTVDTGRYSTAGEGTYFLTGMRVLVQQWAVEAITVAAEAFILAVDADAGFVWLPSAPTAPMQAEINADRARVVFNRYDTAGQTTLAKQYLHVADDADDLLGASGVQGFRVS